MAERRGTDPQREGRQLHRYRSQIVRLKTALHEIRAELEPEHLADHDEDQIGRHIEHVVADAALKAARDAGSVSFRPLLVSGLIGDSDAGICILIDSEQPERQQVVALWHETLHMLGLEDEEQVEAMAKRLAEACPEILQAVKAAKR